MEEQDNSSLEQVRKEALDILHRRRLGIGTIQNLKVLFSKFYKISIRGEERFDLGNNLNEAIVESIHNSVRDAKINRKATSKKLREKLQEARNGK